MGCSTSIPVDNRPNGNPPQESKRSMDVLEVNKHSMSQHNQPTVTSPPHDNQVGSPPQDNEAASTPQNNHVTSPPQDNQATSPLQDNQVASPPQDNEAASTPQNKHVTSPPQDNQATSPLQDNQVTSPPQDNQATSPLQDNQATSPLQDNQVTSPPQDNQATSLPQDNQVTSPPQDNQATSLPLDNQGTSPPPDNQATNPPQDNQATSPHQENQPSSPSNKSTNPQTMSLKPLTGLISDVVVPVPAEDVQKSSGFALDIGSTIGKIIYRSNKEYKDGQPINSQDDSSKGQVHFAMFPRSDVNGMVDYIKENCDLKANEEGKIVVNSSGVGGANFRKDFEAALNCKLDILPEFDCFCKAFLALEKVVPPEDFFTPQSEAVNAELEAYKAKIMEMMGMTDTALVPDAGKTVKEEDRPRLLVMAGSGTGILQINNDGTCAILDGLYMAGRFMYGLASMLTGENDFDNLDKMAAESDGKTTDLWLSDLLSDSGPSEGEIDNIYDLAGTEDEHLFPFGKGINVPMGDMKKGDMVWSVFNATATIHAQLVLANVKLSNAKAVYFCGNTFNSGFMRDRITKVISSFSILLPENQQFEYQFLKNGGMYGAMGAFLHVKKAE